ncbi:MAG: hypothetical protein ACI8PQ_001634, partial [Planctomycetota bacterium]
VKGIAPGRTLEHQVPLDFSPRESSAETPRAI